jgi:hypothetical protein
MPASTTRSFTSGVPGSLRSAAGSKGREVGGNVQGALEVGTVAGAALAAELWNRTRPQATQNDWRLGEIVIGTLVGAGVGSATTLRRLAAGVVAGALTDWVATAYGPPATAARVAAYAGQSSIGTRNVQRAVRVRVLPVSPYGSG